MSRSDRTGNLIFDPKIEKTVHRLRKETKERRKKYLALESSSDLSSDELELEEKMDHRTPRELAAPNLTQQHLCITYPMVYDAAEDWLFNLPAGNVTTWTDMKKKFLEKRIIDASSGGGLMNKTPRDAWDLLNNMAMNSQQFGPREAVAVKEASEGRHKLRLVGSMQVQNILLIFLNLKYGNQQANFGDYSREFPTPNHPPQPPQTVPSNSLKDMMKTMASNMLQFQQETRNSIRNLEEQVSQIPNEMCEIKSREKGRLPSQPDANPRNVSSIVIQNGKDAEVLKIGVPKDKNEEDIEKEIEQVATETSNKVTFDTPTNTKTNVALFPYRLAKPKKNDKNKEMMEIFRKLELNIPLLDAIKQVPKYAKFLKDLCANKKRLRRDEYIIAGESVSVVLQHKLPPKYGDPGMFSVPCKIGKLEIKRAMLDLGAAINVMPKSIYKFLNIGPLKKTEIIIQLADRTNAYPE
ncbi:uncharacterized protein LOC127261037 [Andrographis paniculata]|uniref:uncharacterized protein LOC127261037 n=1 Tax=Andrographis paniculata TaxID=175694 RepID=UPI0021E92D09|nr:uncharacterized protein LOC127261037 [Andrographis paniculata]